MDEQNKLRNLLTAEGINADLSFSILNNINAGKYVYPPIQVSQIPGIDGRQIIDMTGAVSWQGETGHIRDTLSNLGFDPDLIKCTRTGDRQLLLDKEQLTLIGRHLLPLLAYGILNGGMATSYADEKKNKGFHDGLFQLNYSIFSRMADLCAGQAKGITPAFINPDGTPGPSFIELKLRHLLLHGLQYRKSTGRDTRIPLFQMTSQSNHSAMESAFEAYRDSPLLKEFLDQAGIGEITADSGIQPLLAAYTHGTDGTPRRIFTSAYGKPDSPLPLPGGHGQNFLVLKEVYKKLLAEGKRFVYLTNVDNTGSTIDPVSLAILALSGRPAGFDFAFRTPVDVKGGILIIDQNKRLNCVDLGVGISPEEVDQAEQQGKPVLFNCATGLFDLAYLVRHIDTLISDLPMRVSDQDKDAGRYSQAEQVTWEVIGLLDKPLIFAIDKFDRFLAAKLLQENLMTSGINLQHPDYPRSADPASDLHTMAARLHTGLSVKLARDYAMELKGDQWRPLNHAGLPE